MTNTENKKHYATNKSYGAITIIILFALIN